MWGGIQHLAHAKCHVNSYYSQILLTWSIVEFIAYPSKGKENPGRNFDSVVKPEGGTVNICWELEAGLWLIFKLKSLLTVK